MPFLLTVYFKLYYCLIEERDLIYMLFVVLWIDLKYFEKRRMEMIFSNET
jgi:hypothetical protein